MQIRNLSPHTIDGYIRYVAQFAQHFGVSPDRLGPEHVRTYQLYLLEQQVHQSILVQTVCALRFLYEKTLHRPWTVEYIPFPKKIKTLPIVLSRDEVQTLIRAPRHFKHRVILPGSREGLLPPSPLRTARTSFPIRRSSLSNAL